MHVPSRSQRTRSRSIILHGALLATVAALAGCGDDDEGRRLSPQVEKADGVYRTSSGSSPVWRNGGSPSGSEADETAERSTPSNRGGFGSSGSFFHFGS